MGLCIADDCSITTSFFEGEVVNPDDTWLFRRNRDASQNLEKCIVTDPYTDRRANTCRSLSIHGKHQCRQYMIGPIGPSRIRYRPLEAFSKNDAFTIRVIAKPFRNRSVSRIQCCILNRSPILLQVKPCLLSQRAPQSGQWLVDETRCAIRCVS